MTGTGYQRFQAAARYLRGHPQATDEDVASAIGVLPRELALGSGPGTPADIISRALPLQPGVFRPARWCRLQGRAGHRPR